MSTVVQDGALNDTLEYLFRILHNLLFRKVIQKFSLNILRQTSESRFLALIKDEFEVVLLAINLNWLILLKLRLFLCLSILSSPDVYMNRFLVIHLLDLVKVDILVKVGEEVFATLCIILKLFLFFM